MDGSKTDSLSREQIESFFHDLEFRFDTMEELNLFLANRFNVFRYISPDERKLSYIIRDLLDPGGVHGQGDHFLRHFLEIIGLSHVGIAGDVVPNCEVRTEHAKNQQRRIDILFSPDGRFGVGIENKPWAGDQPGWVEDYSEHLRQKFQGNFLLVFLTKEGREPESEEDRQKKEHLEESGQFRTISYEADFRDWLERCCKDCEAETVRRFLKDFIDYAQAVEARGMASENDVKLVADYIEKSHRHLRIAYATKQAWVEVRERLAEKFLDNLQGALRADLDSAQKQPDGTWAKDWEIDNPRRRVFEKYDFRMYRPRWQNRHAICLSADKREGRDFFIGVWKNGKRGDVTSVNGLDAALKEKVDSRGVQGLPWWEWRRWVDDRYRNWDTADGLEELVKPEALNDFKELFLEIVKVAGPRIDEHYGKSPDAG